jgi:hypothetical protein
MPFEQIANILVSVREAPIVVFLEKLQIIFVRRIPFPASIYHSIKYNEMSVLNFSSKFRGSSLPL